MGYGVRINGGDLSAFRNEPPDNRSLYAARRKGALRELGLKGIARGLLWMAASDEAEKHHNASHAEFTASTLSAYGMDWLWRVKSQSEPDKPRPEQAHGRELVRLAVNELRFLSPAEEAPNHDRYAFLAANGLLMSQAELDLGGSHLEGIPMDLLRDAWSVNHSESEPFILRLADTVRVLTTQ